MVRKGSSRGAWWAAAIAGLALLAVIQTSTPSSIEVSPLAVFHPQPASAAP